MEPEWLTFARRYLGRAEVVGPGSNPWIVSMWMKLRAGWLWLRYRDDSALPWCGLLVGSVFNELGYQIPSAFYRARAWLEWGIKLDFPTVGCVVVYERKGGGHVGFIVGENQNGDLMTLGGNQRDSVSIAPFSRGRVLGYRWPGGVVVSIAPLPLMNSGATVSLNEA